MAETQNLRQSANKLFLSPPALTRQLQTLEDHLSFKLFERKNNRLKLNAKGQAFLAMIKPVLESLDRINAVDLPALQQQNPALRIAMSHVFEQRLFCKINEQVKRDPLFTYDLSIADKSQVMLLLNHYDVDVAVMVLTDDEIASLEQSSFVVKRFQEIVFDVYMAKTPFADQGAEIFVEKSKPILQSSHKDQLAIDHAIYFSSYATIVNAIKSGIGFGFLPTVLLSVEDQNELVNINAAVTARIPQVTSYYIHARETPMLDAITTLFG